jgi:hypothetical protein
MGRRFFMPFLFLLVALLVGQQVGRDYLVAVLLTLEDGEEARALAVRVGGHDPRAVAARGKYLLYRAAATDPQAGIEALQEAVLASPSDYRYWLELGRGYEAVGEPIAAAVALQRAVELAPRYFETHWTRANILLRAGRTEEAVAQFGEALQLSEGVGGGTNRRAAINVYQALTGSLGLDPALLLRVSPGDSIARATLVYYLATQGAIEPAMALMEGQRWKDTPAVRAMLLELLRRTQAMGQFEEAWQVWGRLRQVLEGQEVGEEPIPLRVENGGFERPPLAESVPELRRGAWGFDWRIDPHPQVVVRRDDQHPLQGARSLHLLFATPMDLPYDHLTLLVPVEPGTTYRLRFLARAKDLPLEPPRLEVQNPARPDHLLGEVSIPRSMPEPRELAVEFEVPPATAAVRLALRTPIYRTVTTFERASLWLDGLSLDRVQDRKERGEGR